MKNRNQIWNFAKATIVSACLTVTACGGGGGGGNPANDTFVNYVDSDNGTIVKDRSGDNFKISATDRRVFSNNLNAYINDTYVDPDTQDLYVDGSYIGRIILSRSTSGGQITVFAWFDSSDGWWKFIEVYTNGDTEIFEQTDSTVTLVSGGGSSGGGSSGGGSSGGGSSGGNENADDTPFGATVIFEGNPRTGQISTSDTEDYYLFTPASSGPYEFVLNGQGAGDLDLFIYDSSQNELASSEAAGPSESVQYSLSSGTPYYILVEGFFLPNNTVSYTLSVGQPRQASVTWTLEDSCSDGLSTDLRFFEVSGGSRTGGVWPQPGSVYNLDNLGRSETYSLACEAGTQVCYGAKPRSLNATGTWGIGIDGDQSCEDCCITCSTSGPSATRDLVCN